MSQVETSITPSQAEIDKQTIRELFYAKCLAERVAPLFKVMMWFLGGCPQTGEQTKLLPGYCYNILAVFQRTYFKNLPLLNDTVLIINQAALPAAKTIDDAKKVIRFDWFNLGKAFAIAKRCIRFAELEAEDEAGKDGFENETPEKAKQLFTLIFGKTWVEQNEARILATPTDKLFSELLNEFIATWVAQHQEAQPKMNALAYQWSSEAMIQYNQGFAAGMTGFLDEHGQLVGESERSGVYFLLLLIWPEIQAMQSAQPRKTIPDLHAWLQPFVRVGIINAIDVDMLRDVCEPPPRGIGISLRPLKARPPSAE